MVKKILMSIAVIGAVMSFAFLEPQASSSETLYKVTQEEYDIGDTEYAKTKQIIVSNNFAQNTERLEFCTNIEESLEDNINNILVNDIKTNEILNAFNNTSQLVNDVVVAVNDEKNSITIETQTVDYDANIDEVFALAVIIWCEAGNQSYEGKVAVGNVVLNRVASPRFKQNTIIDVIRAPGQFSPVGSGWFDREIRKGTVNESCMQAALDALAGVNVVGDRLFFHVWNGREPGLVIGAHVFN